MHVKLIFIVALIAYKVSLYFLMIYELKRGLLIRVDTFDFCFLFLSMSVLNLDILDCSLLYCLSLIICVVLFHRFVWSKMYILSIEPLSNISILILTFWCQQHIHKIFKLQPKQISTKNLYSFLAPKIEKSSLNIVFLCSLSLTEWKFIRMEMLRKYWKVFRFQTTLINNVSKVRQTNWRKNISYSRLVTSWSDEYQFVLFVCANFTRRALSHTRLCHFKKFTFNQNLLQRWEF